MSERMTLHPLDAHAVPPARSVATALQECGLLGEALEGATFAAGPAFAELVVFLGCSPVLVREPDTAWRIALRGPWAHARLLRATSLPAPRCPACRTAVPDWEAVAARLDVTWRCAACAAITQPCAFDWRRRAGCGRICVDILGVHPDEGVPADALLAALEGTGAGPWTWFYR